MSDSIAKQLAERRARLQQQQRANTVDNPNVNPPSNHPHHGNDPVAVPDSAPNDAYSAFADGMSDYDIAMQLQRRYDQIDAAPADQADAHSHDDHDSDIEMLSTSNSSRQPQPPQEPQPQPQPLPMPQQQPQPANNGLIDEDYEIAMQLQRQFDSEQSNVPPPSTHSDPHSDVQQQQQFAWNNRGQPASSSSSHHFSFTSTGPDGQVHTFSSSDGSIPPQFRPMFATHSTSNHQHQHQHQHHSGSQDAFGSFGGFNHPFFSSSNQGMPPMPGMQGFDHPFFSGQTGQSGASGSNPHGHGMQFNIMMNHFPPMMMMNNGGDLQSMLQMLHPRPPVASQQDIEQNTATETYRGKEPLDEKTAESEKEEEADPNNTCSICLEPFKNGEAVRRLPCLHIFHRQEIDKWLREGNDKCPICRVPISGQIENQ